MEEENSSRPQDGHGQLWTWIVLGTLIFYLLSPPPLAWVFERLGMEPPEWPRYVYAPIIWAYEEFQAVEDFYEGYADLLGVEL